MFYELTKEFLARIPVSKLDWKLLEETLSQSAEIDKLNDSDDSVLICQENIFNATVNHPLNLKHPLPDGYIHSFLKQLISKVEQLSCEVHCAVLEKYTELISRNLSSENSGYRTFMINEHTSISLKENISIISDGTTGLYTWQAAFYLSEWCIYNRERIAGKRVVELGSGAGLVGLTCFKMCHPKFITMTDFHGKVLESLRYNLSNNTPTTESDSAVSIEVQSLDWVEYSKDESLILPADFILASDVVYDVDLIPALVGTLSKLLHSKNDHLSPSTAIVTCTERNEETLNHFLSELVVQKLTYKELEHAPAIFACQRNYPVTGSLRSIKNFQDGSNRSLVKVTGILFDRHLQLNGVLTRAKRNLNKEPKMGLAQQQQQQQRGLSYRQAADELMRI